jgi:hypothetical protein
MTPHQPLHEVDRFLARVYDLFLTEPITSAFRDEDGPEDEPPPTDPELMMAVQADRFMLMSAVRRLRNEAQKELPL